MSAAESSRKRGRGDDDDNGDKSDEGEEGGEQQATMKDAKETSVEVASTENSKTDPQPPAPLTAEATVPPPAAPETAPPPPSGAIPPEGMPPGPPPPYGAPPPVGTPVGTPGRGPPPPPGYGHPYYPPPGAHPGYPPPPPPGQPGEAAPHPGYPPPPPRGYEAAPPPYGYGYYMGPPPPYSMYPPPPPHYQHMYPPPPPHGAPYYPDPHAPPPPPRYEQEAPPPYGAPPPPMRHPEEEARKHVPRNEGRPGGVDDDTASAEDSDSAAVSARLKTYIKPRVPSTQEVLDRRSRKNAQSRSRAAKLRARILEIEVKPETERTEEEIHLWQQYEHRRQRKNDRSRERALEKKEEIDRILAKPEKKRTKIEKQFLETALGAKKRKNEGDRLRRQRLKELGISTKGTGIKPGISARGPLPVQYTRGGPPPPHHQQHPYHMPHPGMQDIPMSPLPSMPHHHHGMASPGGFASPGMMPGMGFPSPSHRAPRGTPGRMPFMPPSQAYDAQSPPQNPPASRVEQRRNPDGSMSISIGGPGGAGPSFGGEARMPGSEEQDEVSGLLLENENGYNDEGQGGQQDQEGKTE